MRLLALLLLPVLPLAPESLTREAERQRAPEFELTDPHGDVVRLSDYAGKVVLLDFWATWCIPCKEEIPWFQEFERKYKGRGFAVVGVSMDEDGWTSARPYMARMGISYRVVLGDARTRRKYGSIDSLPVTFLIDRQRRVAAIHFGLVSRKKLEQQIQRLLEPDSAAPATP